MKNFYTILFALMGVAVAVANPKDSLAVQPIQRLHSSAVVDTLPTQNKELSVVLFNDNSWRYIRNDQIKPDSTIFAKYWDENNLFPYYNVPLSEIPLELPLQLVDSLGAYHYPFKGYISSRYGVRGSRNHNGVDMPLKVGDTIYSAFNGRVRYSKSGASGYGTLVIIRHDNGIETYHAHLSSRLVEAGDRVVAGQPIALGGNSGRSTGPHLHFECRYMGRAFDPERLINFRTGELRRDFIVMKRSYFSNFSRYEQDWNGEKEISEADKKERQQAAPRQYHKVVSGDCLSTIARRYKTTVAAICKLNKIEENAILQLNKTLRVK